MLSNERASNFKTWLDVGLALHSIDTSLLDRWLTFSYKSVNHQPDEVNDACLKTWSSFKSPIGDFLTFRSLIYWAKLDNPEEYKKYVSERKKKLRNASISKHTTYNTAKAFHEAYSDRFMCTGGSGKETWWEFQKHRWVRMEHPSIIIILLSEEFQNEYRRDLIALQHKISEIVEDDDKEIIQKKINIINKITNDLLNIKYKNQIVEELKHIYKSTDPLFQNKLDTKTHLIGFANGVYDLKNELFREGTPDDYITLSTKQEYKKFSIDNKYYGKIMNFLQQIFPNENVRSYFMKVMSSCLSGETKDEKFYILTGSGANGKSLFVELINHALGDYSITSSNSLVTKKCGRAGEASPEIVRLKGKRFSVLQEPEPHDMLYTGKIKELTGGDILCGRDLYAGSNGMIEFKPQCKFFLCCNLLPKVQSNDDGTWRRISVIEFISKFKDNPKNKNEYQIDTRLKSEIQDWAGYFLNYLLHIYITEYKLYNYLEQPLEVLHSTHQYKNENDDYKEFFDLKLKLTDTETDKLSKHAMHEYFMNWIKKHNSNCKLNTNRSEFEKNMNEFIPTYDETFYYNIAYKDECD